MSFLGQEPTFKEEAMMMSTNYFQFLEADFA